MEACLSELTFLFYPVGNLRTVDKDGPYNLEGLNTSAAHVKGAATSSWLAQQLKMFFSIAPDIRPLERAD